MTQMPPMPPTPPIEPGPLGPVKMMKLQNYKLALTASIVAMIPCISPCCLLGLPFGIWALVVLTTPR